MNKLATKTMIVTPHDKVGDTVVLGRHGGAYTTRYVIESIETTQREVKRREWRGNRWINVVNEVDVHTATLRKA